MNAPVVREHTDAVLAALASVGVPVGDAEAPAGATKKYLVVWPIGSGPFDGTLADKHRTARLVYQVTGAGVSREQAEWLRDEAFDALRAGVEVDDRRVTVSHQMHGPVARDDDTRQPVLWTASVRFELYTVPAVTVGS